MLQILKRPQGSRLNTTDITAVIYDSSGDALVYTGTAHGLSDGDVVYIESNFDSYNGYKIVDSISYDAFKIKDNESENTPFVREGDISYRVSVLQHGWQSVHLPIVYEMQSDLWPNNQAEESYNPNTVVTQANNNGYTQLNLIHAISPDPKAMNYVKLVGTGTLAGSYQIVAVLQDWSIVINLAYDAANSFTGYQVVNYYNNYAANIEVWAGLDSGHRWASVKPYELAVTLKFIPDSEGKIKFSISDILKSYIITRNNLTLDTLPNNLDFHVSFYIKYFESYDLSDGITIETETGETETDSFEGHAVNSMMPFKSLDAGYMSEYVNEDTFLAKWLTTMDVPTVWADRFFDISFILQFSGVDVTVTIFKQSNGIVTNTEIIIIENPGLGIIRVPIIPALGFDRYCLQASISGSGSFSLASFQNNAGAGEDWLTGSTPSVSFASAPSISDILYLDVNFIPNVTYTITTIFTSSVVIGSFNVSIFDDSFNQLEHQGVSINDDINTLTFTATEEITKIGVSLIVGATGITNLVSMSYTIAPLNVTEQICLNVIQDCDNSFVNDNLRLTQSSIPRIIQ